MLTYCNFQLQNGRVDTQNPLKTCRQRLGLGRISQICEVSREAARKWVEQGFLPRTEWTGETNYAERIAAAYELERRAKPQLEDPPMTAEILLACKPSAKPPAHPPGAAGVSTVPA